MQLGRPGEALTCYQRGLGICQASGTRVGVAEHYRNIGAALARLGRAEEAGHHLSAAADLYTALGRTYEADDVRARLADLGPDRAPA